MSQNEQQAPLVVHTDTSDAWGGQEIRGLTELREMRRLGFRVALIVPKGAELAKRAAAEQIPVYEVQRFSKLRLSSWVELWRLLRRLQPTVLNTHSSEDSWICGALGRLLHVPMIARTRHVLTSISSKVSYNLFPHIIFTCSQAIADQIASQGVHKDKLVVASTGNDEERFRFSQEKRQTVRQKYGIDEQQVVLGNVGFFRHYKGHPFIIKTLAALPEQYIAMLVGDGEYLPQIKELAAQLGVSDRVIFAGAQEDPAPFFSAFDLLFFSSSEAEGVSQALIQGLLNGLPVLGCDIPSTREVLAPIEAHRLVAYDDVQAAATLLQELADLPRRDPQRMERQHTLVADHYGLLHMMRILLSTYQRYGVLPPDWGSKKEA